MSDKDDVLSGTPFSGDQQNTNEQDPDVLFGSQRQNLEDTDDREALESNESSRVGSVQVNYQHPLKANRRRCSTSLPSRASAGKSIYSGNSSIQISAAISMNEDDTLIDQTNTGDTGEESGDFNSSTMMGSKLEKQNNFQRGSRRQSSCIDGVLNSKLESLGSSFGSFLGIHTPVKMIDKTPLDEDAWQYDEASSSNVRALSTHHERRKDSVSSRANESASSRSAQTGQTPANDSFALSDGTIPFLPELSGDDRRDGKSLPKLSYRSSTIGNQTTEVNSSTIMPPCESFHTPDNETIFSDVEELARNGFNIAQSEVSGVEELKGILRKASDFELEGDYEMALEFYGKCMDFYYRVEELSIFRPTNKHHMSVASLLHNIGVVYWKVGAYDDSLRALRRARHQIDEALSLCDEDDIQPTQELLCDILNTIGRIYASKGEFELALDHHSESLSILKSLFVDNKIGATDKNSYSQDNAPGKDDYQDQIIKYKNETIGMNHPGIARALICMGSVHASSGRLPIAMELFKGGLEIQRKLLGSKHVDVAATLNSIGSVYEKTGRQDKAMQCYKKARQIYVQNLGKDHVDVATTLNNIGQIYHHFGKHQKAMDSFRSGLRIMKRVLGKSHRNVAAIYFNIGLVHVQCCQYELAMKVFKETLLLQREALGDEHVDVALTLESIGGIYEQRLRIDRALELYYKALSIRQRATKDHLFVAFAMDKIGKCQMNLNGDVREAILCFDEALVLYRANGITENNPLVWEAKKNLATALKVLKQKKRESEDALIGLDITIS